LSRHSEPAKFAGHVMVMQRKPCLGEAAAVLRAVPLLEVTMRHDADCSLSRLW